MQQNKIKNITLALTSGILLALSFPRFNLWILAWFGFLPLFFAIKDKSKFKAFFLFYLTGVIFWLITIYWLTYVTFIGTIFLVLYLALYFGIFGLIVSNIPYALDRLGTPRGTPGGVEGPISYIQLLFIPSVWVILEYLRSYLFTGFGWAVLGYSQYLNLPVIQIADITGVYGVSFLVMMVNVTVYSAINYQPSAIGRRKKLFLPILCMLISLIYGYYKIYRIPDTTRQKPIKISVVQANIPQELKWDARAKDYIINKYFSLTYEALKDKPELIIWPEAALPAVLEAEPFYFEKISSFLKEVNTPLLLGAIRRKDSLYYNSAVLISKEGRILNSYDKLHLVPFGEYIPLRNILGFLETIVPIGDFSSGKEYTIFLQGAIKFSALICFEDLFPQISRQFVERGANFLVNITNDAWFGKTSSPYQHLQASVFRAVENRIFLVRAANTGISGFIHPNGRIISKVNDGKGKEIFIGGHNTQNILVEEKLTFYTQFGDVFVLLVSVLTAYGIILKK